MSEHFHNSPLPPRLQAPRRLTNFGLGGALVGLMAAASVMQISREMSGKMGNTDGQQPETPVLVKTPQKTLRSHATHACPGCKQELGLGRIPGDTLTVLFEANGADGASHGEYLWIPQKISSTLLCPAQFETNVAWTAHAPQDNVATLLQDIGYQTGVEIPLFENAGFPMAGQTFTRCAVLTGGRIAFFPASHHVRVDHESWPIEGKQPYYTLAICWADLELRKGSSLTTRAFFTNGVEAVEVRWEKMALRGYGDIFPVSGGTNQLSFTTTLHQNGAVTLLLGEGAQLPEFQNAATIGVQAGSPAASWFSHNLPNLGLLDKGVRITLERLPPPGEASVDIGGGISRVEAFLRGLDPFSFDHSGDGIPAGVKLAMGLCAHEPHPNTLINGLTLEEIYCYNLSCEQVMNNSAHIRQRIDAHQNPHATGNNTGVPASASEAVVFELFAPPQTDDVRRGTRFVFKGIVNPITGNHADTRELNFVLSPGEVRQIPLAAYHGGVRYNLRGLDGVGEIITHTEPEHWGARVKTYAPWPWLSHSSQSSHSSPLAAPMKMPMMAPMMAMNQDGGDSEWCQIFEDGVWMIGTRNEVWAYSPDFLYCGDFGFGALDVDFALCGDLQNVQIGVDPTKYLFTSDGLSFGFSGIGLLGPSLVDLVKSIHCGCGVWVKWDEDYAPPLPDDPHNTLIRAQTYCPCVYTTYAYQIVRPGTQLAGHDNPCFGLGEIATNTVTITHYDEGLKTAFAEKLMVEWYLAVRTKTSNDDVVVKRFVPPGAQVVDADPDKQYFAVTQGVFTNAFNGKDNVKAVAMQEGARAFSMPEGLEDPNVQSFNNMIPEIKAGQVLPPTLYVMVARLRLRDNPETIISESRMEFGVPQVVKYRWRATSYMENAFRIAAKNHDDNGVIRTLIPQFTEPEVLGARNAVKTKIEEFWADLGGSINVRHVWDERPIQGPFKEIIFQGQPGTTLREARAFGRTEENDRNQDPGYPDKGKREGEVRVFYMLNYLQRTPALSVSNPSKRIVPDPIYDITMDELVHFIAYVAVHEAGHMFGLVNIRQLSTSWDNWHNPQNTADKHIMNSGETELLLQRIGRGSIPQWTPFNKAFLLFVLRPPSNLQP